MAFDVAGLASSYDLPQYVGELFMQVGERPNTLLRAIGGTAGAVGTVRSNSFPVALTRAVQAPAQPAIVEGADPTAGQQQLTQDTNVVQIFQEAVQLTYSAQSNDGAVGGLCIIPGVTGGMGLANPSSFEFQVALQLEKIQNDMNYTFMQGAYTLPTDNLSARKSRGIATAITTNVSTGSSRALTKAELEALLKSMIDGQNASLGQNFWAFCGADQFENLIDLYSPDANPPEDRTVVGVMVRTIFTKWGPINVVYEPDTPSGEIELINLSAVSPVAREISSAGQRKGVLFVEPLDKTGSADKGQVYGEWGCNYGAEELHGSIDTLSA